MNRKRFKSSVSFLISFSLALSTFLGIGASAVATEAENPEILGSAFSQQDNLETAPLAGDAARGTLGGGMGVMALNEFTVNFEAQGENIGFIKGTYGKKIGAVAGGIENLPPAIDTEDMYFTGIWKNKTTGATYSTAEMANQPILTNVTYVAVYADMHRISFCIEGDEKAHYYAKPGQSLSEVVVSEEIDIILEMIAYENPGKIFGCWALADGRTFSLAEIMAMDATSIMVFDAVLKSPATVEFRVADVVIKSIQGYTTDRVSTVIDDQAASDLETPNVPNGKFFAGWMCPDGQVRSIAQILEQKISGNMTYQAVIEDGHTVDFVVNDIQVGYYLGYNGQKLSAITVEEEIETFAEPYAPTGMEFAGWAGPNVKNNVYPTLPLYTMDEVLDQTISGDMTYYARFRKTGSTSQARLSFWVGDNFTRDYNYIGFPGEFMYNVFGDTSNLPNEIVPTPSGKEFAGFLCPDGVVRSPEVFLNFKIPDISEFEFIARFKPIGAQPHSITLIADGQTYLKTTIYESEFLKGALNPAQTTTVSFDNHIARVNGRVVKFWRTQTGVLLSAGQVWDLRTTNDMILTAVF